MNRFGWVYSWARGRMDPSQSGTSLQLCQSAAAAAAAGWTCRKGDECSGNRATAGWCPGGGAAAAAFASDAVAVANQRTTNTTAK